MFSGNQKISCRQLYRNYTAGLISLGALLAPLAMNRENLTQILWALLFLGAWLFGTVYVPRPESVWIKALCYVHYWILGTMAARMTGLLIREFAEGRHFAHLDIAGPAFLESEFPGWETGATGYGVRLLYQTLRLLAE